MGPKGIKAKLVSVALAAGALTMGLVTATPAGATSTTSGKGTVTMALDETLAGFNINTATSEEFVLQEIMDVVWPQPFIISSSLAPVLNTQLLTSATQVTASPLTLVFKINPKAVWSDGTPINADDFIYNWQTQSGNPKFTDVGGAAYQPATTAGYQNISSVVGSNPPGGAACTSGSTADQNLGLCPNGDTVTIKFSTGFADWRSLFSNLVPAHIGRTVGWNTGFNNWQNAISGSWYEIKSYQEGQSVVLTQNPHYWGTPGKLKNIVFSIFSSDTQEVPALQNNEVQIINPATVNLSIVQNTDQVSNVTKDTDPGLEFEHFDFNQANPYLAKLGIRQAIAYGTNRQQIIARTVGEVPGAKIVPLGNRIFVNTQKQYVNNGAQYGTVNDSKAKALLKAQGFTLGSDGYWHPNYGPENGQDLSFTISSTSGNSIRAETETLFQAEMKAIGVKINIQNYAAATFFGTNLPNGDFDIAEFAWVSTPFASGNQSIYCSYSNANNCSSNYDHYADPAVDKLMAAGTAAATPAAETADYNKADALMWKDMVTLPLYQKPQFFAWSTATKGIVPNTSSVGVPWNANLWHTTAA
jgi:peptide/nickel transport system substrate-binding protein